MSAVIVVGLDPFVQIGLQLLNRLVGFSAERHLIELLQDCFVEPLTDAIGLRSFNLGLGMFDIVNGQEQLIIVAIRASAILGSPVGENAQHRQIVLFIERQHFVVEHVCRGDRGFGFVQLGLGDLGVGVDVGLLIDAPDAFQGADIESIL